MALYSGVHNAKDRMGYFNLMFAFYTAIKISMASFEVVSEVYSKYPTIYDGLNKAPIFDLMFKSCVDYYGFQWW